MADSCDQPLTQQDLDDQGEEICIKFTRVSPTTGTISWDLPTDLSMYDGLIALLKTSALVPTDFPVDGQRYQASQDIAAPASIIGTAMVVGSFYGDKMTTSVNVINLDPNAVYFASGHAVTNTLQYFTKGRQSYPLAATASTYSGDIPVASAPPLNPTVGQVYYNNQTNSVSMWTGGSWVPAGVGTTLVGPTLPALPPTMLVGQFFYNTTTNHLYCWDGAAFTISNTEKPGVPMYAKAPGDDGSYNERANLISIIKRQLGWPVICVELTEEHFTICVDNAIQEFRRRCDNAYTMKYFIMPGKKNQDIYYFNDPVVGTNKVVDIIKIWRVAGLGLVAQGENGIYSQSFLTQLYAPGVVDLTSIYLMNAYAEQFSQIFAGEISFRWNEASRQMQILRRLGRDEKLLVECSAEKTEQELLVDRYATQWIQGWAVSEAKMILGHIRSKYQTLPGAGGSINLNGSEMLQSALEDQTELLRQVMDFEVGNGGLEFSAGGFCIG
jgi:hypothetical protein